jgi:hypothetical protein
MVGLFDGRRGSSLWFVVYGLGLVVFVLHFSFRSFSSIDIPPKDRAITRLPFPYSPDYT